MVKETNRNAVTMTPTDELHGRLITQARNLLFEYRVAGKDVPVDVVQKLMVVYGNLIADLIFRDQEHFHAKENERLIGVMKRKPRTLKGLLAGFKANSVLSNDMLIQGWRAGRGGIPDYLSVGDNVEGLVDILPENNLPPSAATSSLFGIPVEVDPNMHPDMWEFRDREGRVIYSGCTKARRVA